MEVMKQVVEFFSPIYILMLAAFSVMKSSAGCR